MFSLIGKSGVIHENLRLHKVLQYASGCNKSALLPEKGEINNYFKNQNKEVSFQNVALKCIKL